MRNRTLATLLATSLLFSGCTYSRYTGTTYPLPVIPPEQKLDRPVQVRSSWEKHLQSDQDPWHDYAKRQIEQSRSYIAPMVSEQAHPAAPPLYLELESKSYNNDPGVLTILNGVISGMTLFVIPWRMSFKGGAIMTVSDDHRVLYQAETVGKHVTTIWIGPVGRNDPEPATMMDAYSVHSKAIAEQMQKEYQLFIQAQAGGTAESYERFLQQANWYRYAALRELAGLGMGMRDATAFYDGLMARYNDVASVLPADYLLLARGPANTRLRDLIQRSKRGESAGNLALSVSRSGADYGDFSDDQLRQLVQRGMPVSVLDSVISTTQRTRQYQRERAAEREAMAQAQRQQELQEEREARARQQEEDANRHAVIMGAFADVQQTFNQMGTDLEASRAQNQAVLNEYHAARQRDLEYAAAAHADGADLLWVHKCLVAQKVHRCAEALGVHVGRNRIARLALAAAPEGQIERQGHETLFCHLGGVQVGALLLHCAHGVTHDECGGAFLPVQTLGHEEIARNGHLVLVLEADLAHSDLVAGVEIVGSIGQRCAFGRRGSEGLTSRCGHQTQGGNARASDSQKLAPASGGAFLLLQCIETGVDERWGIHG